MGRKVDALKERRELVAHVVFLLNITKVGDRACKFAVNLVVVEIPEGIESISRAAFANCSGLTTISFATKLTNIGNKAFDYCSLENIDLLHTQLQELGHCAFYGCSELKSMTIPYSIQTLGNSVFDNCSELVPSHIDHEDSYAVVAYLRSQQSRPSLSSP